MRISWSTLGRLRPEDYSGLVRRLRIVLPVCAVLLLAGVVIWPHLDPAQTHRRHVDARAPEMHNSKFSGVDSSNEPYTITADSAVQTSASSNDINLVNPVADITLKTGAWIAVHSDKGQYREDPALITMQGHVRLYHDLGYEVRTTSAAIDLEKGIAYSDSPTWAQGPRGSVQGEGFRLYQDTGRIVFTGNSRLVLKPVEDAEDPAGAVSGGTEP